MFWISAEKNPCAADPSPCNEENSQCMMTDEDFVCNCKTGFVPVPSSDGKLCQGGSDLRIYLFTSQNLFFSKICSNFYHVIAVIFIFINFLFINFKILTNVLRKTDATLVAWTYQEVTAVYAKKGSTMKAMSVLVCRFFIICNVSYVYL